MQGGARWETILAFCFSVSVFSSETCLRYADSPNFSYTKQRTPGVYSSVKWPPDFHSCLTWALIPPHALKRVSSPPVGKQTPSFPLWHKDALASEEAWLQAAGKTKLACEQKEKAHARTLCTLGSIELAPTLLTAGAALISWQLVSTTLPSWRYCCEFSNFHDFLCHV